MPPYLAARAFAPTAPIDLREHERRRGGENHKELRYRKIHGTSDSKSGQRPRELISNLLAGFPTFELRTLACRSRKAVNACSSVGK